MANGSFGKNTEETSSSYIPLNTHAMKQPNPKDSLKKQGTPETEIPRKPINLLRMQDPAYKKMSRMKLLEILMKQPNANAGKSIVINVKSNDEINEAYDTIARENLPLKKQMFLWKVDDYRRTDPEFRKVKRRTHQSLGLGTRAPDEIKKLNGARVLSLLRKSLWN